MALGPLNYTLVIETLPWCQILNMPVPKSLEKSFVNLNLQILPRTKIYICLGEGGKGGMRL